MLMQKTLHLLLLFSCFAQLSAADFDPKQMRAALEWEHFQLDVESKTLLALETVKDKISADKAGDMLLVIYAYRVQKEHPRSEMWEKGVHDTPEHRHVAEKGSDKRIKVILKTIALINAIKDSGLITEKLRKGLDLMGMKNC